jgi:hypothetical protein
MDWFEGEKNIVRPEYRLSMNKMLLFTIRNDLKDSTKSSPLVLWGNFCNINRYLRS